MEPEPPNSVTRWLEQLRAGDQNAAAHLWRQYFECLVEQAKKRLRATGVDDEVVAASAFLSFCQDAMNGRFPNVADRTELWRLLVFITHQKATNHKRKHRAQRRGGGVNFEDSQALAWIQAPEPTPQLAAQMVDEFEHLLDRLGDDTLRKIAVWKIEGLTHAEIAHKLGCAVRTVANKVKLIRMILEEGAERE